jgi:DNA-binding winged helix-turn-helix (wHTH) protein/tetratricopeptide (TPR) repeat protein
MGEGRHDGLAIPGRVVLAHEPAFHIGDVAVHPAIRQIERGSRRQTLEPRVMQVLVALARARGGIVTRDELIETCWDGRVVGDDSINRVLSRIRRVAADLGGGTFAIETIARVGYRLVGPGSSEGIQARAAAPSRQPAFSRRMLVGGAAAIATLAVGGAVAFWAAPKGPGEPAARARSLFDQAVIIRHEDNRQALAFLREAVRISPEYGEAWGALALTYRIAIDEESPERVAGFDERLREAVRNAERHDPGNPDAAAALLLAQPMFGQWSKLEPVYRAAIRRHPGHGAGYAMLGTLLMEVGRWSDAVAVLQSAKARNPSSPVLRYKLIVSLWSAGQISAAEEEIDQAMQLWPQHGAIWQTKIKLLALTGRPIQALALANDPGARPLDERDAPDMPGRLLYLTALATRSRINVEQAIDAAVTRAREVQSERVNAALQLTSLGRTELALDLLEGVYSGTGEWALRNSSQMSIATHPLFQPHARPLWQEPRFNGILAAIGLERHWRTTDTLPDYRRRSV